MVELQMSNGRVTEAVEVAERCPACEAFAKIEWDYCPACGQEL